MALFLHELVVTVRVWIYSSSGISGGFHNEGYNYLSWRLEHNGVSSNQCRGNFGDSKIDRVVKRRNS